MDTAAQDSTKDNPQIYTGPPASAGQSTKNRAKTCDVQKLDQEQTPSFHWGVVHAVRMGDRRGLPVIHTEHPLNETAVQCESHHKDYEGDQERDHKFLLLLICFSMTKDMKKAFIFH